MWGLIGGGILAVVRGVNSGEVVMLHRYLYGVAIGTVLVVSPVFFDASALAASRHRSGWVNTQYVCTYNRRGYRCGYVAVDARGFQVSTRSSGVFNSASNNFPPPR